MWKLSLPTAWTVVVALPLLSACAAVEPAGQVARVQDDTLEVALSEWSLGFRRASADDGDLTVEVRNVGTIPHSLEIEAADGTEIAETEILGPGESRRLEVDLADGTYALYCYVEGHREAGMEATLAVGAAAPAPEPEEEEREGGGGY